MNRIGGVGSVDAAVRLNHGFGIAVIGSDQYGAPFGLNGLNNLPHAFVYGKFP